jgi:hypothetical protein
MVISAIIIKVILLTLVLQQGVIAEEGIQANLTTLDQVQIIFRHGLRSPNKPYPGDPYDDEKFWPQGWGMLTNEGKRQQHELGMYIRERYSGFLSDGYLPAEFYALSSDSDRAIMSLLAHLAGLFPPEEEDSWSEQITNWQPIPFRTIPSAVDRTNRGSAPCPKYDVLWNNLLQSEEFKEANAGFQDLYDYISNYTGEKYTYPSDLTTILEALIIQEAHNMTLPEWTKEIYPSQKSTDLLNFAFSLVVKTEEMKRLRGGPLLRELLSSMDLKVREDSQGKKMILYSGHDITVVRILDTMNLFNPPHLPDFNSVLLIELHRSNTGHNVEVYYRNGSAKLVQLTVEGCPDPCSLEDLKTLLEARVISDADWDKECSAEVVEAESLAVKAVNLWGKIYTHGLRWLI